MDFLNEFPILHTKRLLLRTPTHLDAPYILRTRADAEFSRHTGIPRYSRVQQALDYIERVRLAMQEGETVFWVIESEGRYQGGICLWNMDRSMQKAEVGYDLLPGSRGKGYIGEALGAVLSYAFFTLPLVRVEANGVHPENEKSHAVLRRAGFTAAAEPGDYCLDRGAYMARAAAGR